MKKAKTPDEIKKEFYSIDEIKRILLTRTGIIHDQNKLYMSALDLIQQLETKNRQLLTKVEQLETKCHQLERERDAACLKNQSIETARPWREGGQP